MRSNSSANFNIVSRVIWCFVTAAASRNASSLQTKLVRLVHLTHGPMPEDPLRMKRPAAVIGDAIVVPNMSLKSTSCYRTQTACRCKFDLELA